VAASPSRRRRGLTSPGGRIRRDSEQRAACATCTAPRVAVRAGTGLLRSGNSREADIAHRFPTATRCRLTRFSFCAFLRRSVTQRAAMRTGIHRSTWLTSAAAALTHDSSGVPGEHRRPERRRRCADTTRGTDAGDTDDRRRTAPPPPAWAAPRSPAARRPSCSKPPRPGPNLRYPARTTPQRKTPPRSDPRSAILSSSTCHLSDLACSLAMYRSVTAADVRRTWCRVAGGNIP
jgi:hypothetical protein